MLEVRDIKYFPDGRSIVDTIGGRRFKVLSRHVVDGYNTARVKFLVDDTVGLEQLADLKKLHEETLQQTKDWFDVAFPNYKRISILEHYGKLPDVEPDYWALPNGPSWLWWILNILPVDYKMKVSYIMDTFGLCILIFLFIYFSDTMFIDDIAQEAIVEYKTHFNRFSRS